MSGLTARRLLLAIVGAAVLWFAVQGGQYGTVALVRQRVERKQLVAAIDSLQRQIDSLTRVKRAVSMDAATQERIAREEFGMVRGPKEILYRFATPADSSGDSSRASR